MQETILAPRSEYVNLYKGFANEITGETFKCISNTKDACIFEWIVQPNGYVPFSHIHLNQDEIFHVRKGEVRLMIDGTEVIGLPGDKVRVPKGKPHIAFNNTCDTLECVVSFEPGLDSYKFFQCFGGLTIEKQMDKRGQINVPKMLYFTKRMNAHCVARPTSIPAPLFKVAMYFSYVAGLLFGWEKDYLRHTMGDQHPNYSIL